MKLISFLLIAIISFVGCQRIDDFEVPAPPPGDAPKQRVPAAPAAPAIHKNPEISAIVEALPRPNQYLVRLKWKTEQSSPTWTVNRYEGQLFSGSFSVDGTLSEFLDNNVKPGAIYSYALLTSPTDSSPLRAQAVIPQDLELSNEKELSGTYDVHRVFLRAGTKIGVRKAPLKITAREFYSEQAVIEAGARGKKAATSLSGSRPYDIHIFANRAVGSLRIQTFGENGGDGVPGIDGEPGGEGTAGVAEKARVTSSHSGVFGSGTEILDSFPPGEGLKGLPGKDGTAGGPAGNGGDTAQVIVDIFNESPFSVTVDALPGAGGNGGKSGKGGKGGPGGPPGARITNRWPAPNKGPDGIPGFDGAQGANGFPGKPGPICFRNGDHVTGDCNLIGNQLELK